MAWVKASRLVPDRGHLERGLALANVRRTTEKVAAARREQDDAVAQARADGESWEAIGEASGRSRQAAHSFWGKGQGS